MLFKIVFAFLKLIARIPFWCLHLISDILYLVLYYGIQYRKKVILSNLAIAFPENSLTDNKKTAKKFMRHFADFLSESLKGISITDKELHKRYKYLNAALIKDEIAKDKSIILLIGHYGNWEWLVANLGRVFGILGWAAYKPLSNPLFDKLMVANREQFGFKVIPSGKSAAALKQFCEKGTQFINLLAADQSPPVNYKYRTKFLGQNVPFFIGPEVYAKRYDLSVFYGRILKKSRSNYTVEFIPITMNAAQTDDTWITSQYIKSLEEDIKNTPDYYLWSHRRFKHAKS